MEVEAPWPAGHCPEGRHSVEPARPGVGTGGRLLSFPATPAPDLGIAVCGLPAADHENPGVHHPAHLLAGRPQGGHHDPANAGTRGEVSVELSTPFDTFYDVTLPQWDQVDWVVVRGTKNRFNLMAEVREPIA